MNDGTGFILIGFVLDMRCFLFYSGSIITFLLLIFDVRAAVCGATDSADRRPCGVSGGCRSIH